MEIIGGRGAEAHEQIHEQILEIKFKNIHIGLKVSHVGTTPFSYPEPILRAVNGARQGALAKSISNWHLIGHNEGCCSNTGYILLPCFYGIRLWIWPEPLVAPRVRRALGTRMERHLEQLAIPKLMSGLGTSVKKCPN